MALSSLPLVAVDVMACSCPPPSDPFGTAEVVFVGRLVAVYPVPFVRDFVYLAEVESVLKGHVSSRTLVLAEDSTCGALPLGVRLVVFGARGIPVFLHRTDYCLGTTSNPDPDWLISASTVGPVPLVGAVSMLGVSVFILAVSLRQVWLRLRLGRVLRCG